MRQGVVRWLLAAWLTVACGAPQVVSTPGSGAGALEAADTLEMTRPPPRMPGPPVRAAPGRGGRGGRGRQPRSTEPVFNAEPTQQQREAARRRAENAALEHSLRNRYLSLKAEAEQRYPDKRGQYEEHHFFPVYLGGKENGPKYRLPAAYHQLITNAFRKRWPYGRGNPEPEEAQKIMLKVYSDYPIPQLIGIPEP
jgi:hypothetical protein